jgi:hypothetical protein
MPRLANNVFVRRLSVLLATALAGFTAAVFTSRGHVSPFPDDYRYRRAAPLTTYTPERNYLLLHAALLSDSLARPMEGS